METDVTMHTFINTIT